MSATHKAVLAASQAYSQSTQPEDVKAQMFYVAIKNYPDMLAVVKEARQHGLPVPTDAEINKIQTHYQATTNYFSNRPEPAQAAQPLVGSLEPKSNYGLARIASAMRADMPAYLADLQWQQNWQENEMQSGGGKSRRKGRKGRKGRRKGRKSRKH